MRRKARLRTVREALPARRWSVEHLVDGGTDLIGFAERGGVAAIAVKLDRLCADERRKSERRRGIDHMILLRDDHEDACADSLGGLVQRSVVRDVLG